MPHTRGGVQDVQQASPHALTSPCRWGQRVTHSTIALQVPRCTSETCEKTVANSQQLSVAEEKKVYCQSPLSCGALPAHVWCGGLPPHLGAGKQQATCTNTQRGTYAPRILNSTACVSALGVEREREREGGSTGSLEKKKRNKNKGVITMVMDARKQFLLHCVSDILSLQTKVSSSDLQLSVVVCFFLFAPFSRH